MSEDILVRPPSPFVHLHVHSMFSLYDALGEVQALVERAKALQFDAIALTDHGGLYGAVEFYEAAKKAGIKPIIGVEAYVAPHKHTDKRPGIDTRLSHLTLLAETNEGYQNLLALVSKSFLDGFYYKPRIDKDLLHEHRRGLIVLSGCQKGEIAQACHAHDDEAAETLAIAYRDMLEPDHFFLELVHHPESPTQADINERLIALSRRLGLPTVATKDAHYLHADDREAQDALLCIHDGKLLADQNRLSMSSMDLSLTSAVEMITAFRDCPEAIENTRKIADRCQVELALGKNLLPTFPVPNRQTPESYLRDLCLAGLEERYPDAALREQARQRMEFELATIERMGFAAYFLIVQDYIVWAKQHGVIVGPGRGSAAGSVVAFALKITNLDPLRYGLLFERFLNPDRISMPDIDTDFDDVKRKDVIEYVSQKYGRDRVAGIITFGTMAARAAVRDVGRVLGFTFQQVDRVAKVIPPPVQGKHIPLKTSVQEAPELRAMYEQDPQVKRLLDLAIKLEGTTRHASQHACGIVIAPQALMQCAPLQKAQGGDVDQVIQYSLHSAEAMGLLKMDFLGLSNLSIIRDCLEIIQAVYGDAINVETIPLDDQKTFDMLGRAETTGVFQLESEGMKKHIRELKPNAIEDIIAMVALYRPGPMQFIESFIARKHGREKIRYQHPLTENALKNTYGLPIYQEQVMQVAKDMAGFSGGQADTLRKAMGKKNAKLMAEMKIKFIDGSAKNGVPTAVAEAIFTQFEEFAAYGFNKSHAACYALIAYQTAYLKAHYPQAFMAALLNSDCADLDRITIEVEECRRMGLVVLPPDINESFGRFSVVKDSNRLRFGLLAIKGLGEDVVEIMIAERKRHGPYVSLANFAERIPGKAFNRRSLEALIKTGALDVFGERNALFFNIEAILEYHHRLRQEATTGQVNLFSIAPARAQAAILPSDLALKPAPPIRQRDKLLWEKELLGLYVSSHPFKEYGELLKGLFTPIAQLPEHKKAKSLRLGGILSNVKKIMTKTNEPMLFVKLEDLSGEVEVIVFPRIYRDKPDIWQNDRTVVVSGRPQEKDGAMHLLAESGYELHPDNVQEVAKYLQPSAAWTPAEPPIKDQAMTQASSTASLRQAVTIRLRAQLPESMLHKLRGVFDQHPGPYQVYFAVDQAEGSQCILSSYHISFDELIAKEVESILGTDTVKVGE